MKLDIKVYRGYANEREIIIFGHVFKKNGPDRYAIDKRRLKHAYAVLRMFTIKTMANANVFLHYDGQRISTKTLTDGYFRFAIPQKKELPSGWHDFMVEVEHGEVTIQEKGEFIKPHPGEYGLISDIDDTFLVSHSGTFFKKLYVMLTRNVNKRKVFDGVIEHYRLLSRAGRKDKTESNAFFYVSSSEWNLYNFIEAFTHLHEFPKAVLKLKKIKSALGDFLFTGGGSHDHKYQKIKHLIEFYPELKFILMGDDSQKDPYIYERCVKISPKNITAIYIRQTRSGKKGKVVKVIQNMADMGVAVCYCDSSQTAIAHSREIGLI